MARNSEKVEMFAPYSKLLISCLCMAAGSARYILPPCLKGRKQRERREDVSDLVEGSPGTTLKPRRLNGGRSERS